jgi:hypothetical protein
MQPGDHGAGALMPDRRRTLRWPYRLLINAGIGACMFVFVFCVLVLVIWPTGYNENRIYMTMLGVGLLVLKALVETALCAAAWTTRWMRPISVLGIGTAWLTLGMYLIALNRESRDVVYALHLHTLIYDYAPYSLVIPVAFAQWALLALIPARTRTMRIMCAATRTLGVAVAVLFMAVAWIDANGLLNWSIEEIVQIAISITTVLAVLMTVVTPIAALSRSNREEQTTESLARSMQFAFTCPKCAQPLQHEPGVFRCDRCRATLLVEIDEPRCECGYVLFNLTGSTCPECGREAPEHLCRHLAPQPADEGDASPPAAVTPPSQSNPDHDAAS